MKGIDISSWQAGLDAGKIPADFVIVKATEGTDYVNPNCDEHYQQAAAAGKKLGVYHFARNGSMTRSLRLTFSSTISKATSSTLCLSLTGKTVEMLVMWRGRAAGWIECKSEQV